MDKGVRILDYILNGALGVMFMLIPCVNLDYLMNGTQSGKTFVFLYAILFVFSIYLLKTILKPKKYLQFNALDFFLMLWCFFILINYRLKGLSVTLAVIEFIALILLFIVIRTSRKNYLLLLFASIVGGLIQAVYGNLQLWDYFPSHHGMFKMTGSFFNPGPYAGYLSSIFPVALGIYLYKNNLINPHNSILRSLEKSRITNSLKSFFKFDLSQYVEKNSSNILGYFAVIVIITVILVMPASRSRAAWLAIVFSSCFLCAIYRSSAIKQYFNKLFNTTVKRFGVVIFIIMLSLFVVYGLYNLKKGSADGRILIWEVAINMIKDKPISGLGFDQFKAGYMDYQAAWFKANLDSPKAMVAGDNNYAFNELLQLTVENGLIGGILFVAIILFALLAEKCDLSIKEKRIQTIAKAGIISVFVFSMFSYPFQILPIKMNMVLCLAILSAYSPQLSFSKVKVPKWVKYMVVYSIIVVAGFYMIKGFGYIKTNFAAYKDWKSAYQLYQFGVYDTCLEDYEKAYPVLKNNGDFLTNYGKALSMAEKHEKAVEVLNKAVLYYPNTVVYTALGDSYKKLNRIDEAEVAYLHAWYMNPSRFYPKYLLAKLYDESGQRGKAVNTARELLDKEIKVESTAIEEIMVEMNKIISRK